MLFFISHGLLHTRTLISEIVGWISTLVTVARPLSALCESMLNGWNLKSVAKCSPERRKSRHQNTESEDERTLLCCVWIWVEIEFHSFSLSCSVPCIARGSEGGKGKEEKARKKGKEFVKFHYWIESSTFVCALLVLGVFNVESKSSTA